MYSNWWQLGSVLLVVSGIHWWSGNVFPRGQGGNYCATTLTNLTLNSWPLTSSEPLAKPGLLYISPVHSLPHSPRQPQTPWKSCPDLLSTISLPFILLWTRSSQSFVSPMPMKQLYLPKPQGQFPIFLRPDLRAIFNTFIRNNNYSYR